MVDVDRRAPAQAAALRRLSARAAAASTPSASPHSANFSFHAFASSALARLRDRGVEILPGLSDLQLCRAEAALGFSFPPDLRAVLAAGLPAGDGFPDWRSLSCVRSSLDVPLAVASLQVARGALWPRAWGARPKDAERALRAARAAIRRAPVLVPVFERCYIPCRPCLAGNPVFFVGEDRVVCCAADLMDFFARLPDYLRGCEIGAGEKPRWIEFWSDAASDRRRRDSSSSESSAASSCSTSSSSSPPKWIADYLGEIGDVLREGGWEEKEVIEMVDAGAAGPFDREDLFLPPSIAGSLDADAALDALVVRTDRCSGELRRAGWSSDEVSDALGFEFWPNAGHRPPPSIAMKAEQLAHALSNY